MVEHIAVILCGFFGLVQAVMLGWFKYNQGTRDKMTDLRIQKAQHEAKIKSKRRADNSSLVYGELWNILYELKADRVYIVQPHPLGNESMLSIYYEVDRKGVSPMKPHVQQLQIKDVAKFSSNLVKTLFMYITDIDEQVSDKYAKALLSSYGCQNAIVKRLSDNHNDWNGSIFCEFLSPMTKSEEEARDILHNAATNIQYILPEFE